jgi:hypothetical protein
MGLEPTTFCMASGGGEFRPVAPSRFHAVFSRFRALDAATGFGLRLTSCLHADGRRTIRALPSKRKRLPTQPAHKTLRRSNFRRDLCASRLTNSSG